MEQVEKKRKKVDLLGFQRTLNSHFLEIVESKNTGLTFDSDEQTEADLGLEAVASGLQFFLPLKSLKTISMDNSFEDSIFTKSWILGFNQLRGEIYTITDFEKVVDLILDGKTSNVKNRLNNESRIVYLKNSDAKMAFTLSKLKLDYTAELTSIFKFTGKDNSLRWKLEDGIEFDAFVKQDKMSDKEWTLMNDLHAIVSLDSSLDDVEEKIQTAKEVNLLYFVRDIYLDSNGARPVFVLNTNNLTNYLANVSPF
jgi:hypothetical protein